MEKNKNKETITKIFDKLDCIYEKRLISLEKQSKNSEEIMGEIKQKIKEINQGLSSLLEAHERLPLEEAKTEGFKGFFDKIIQSPQISTKKSSTRLKTTSLDTKQNSKKINNNTNKLNKSKTKDFKVLNSNKKNNKIWNQNKKIQSKNSMASTNDTIFINNIEKNYNDGESARTPLPKQIQYPNREFDEGEII